MPAVPEGNPPLVLPRRLRVNLARAHDPGCTPVILVLLLCVVALVALVYLPTLWVVIPFFAVVLGMMAWVRLRVRREVSDESRWAVERTEFRPRRVWRVLTQPEDGEHRAWYEYNEAMVFREESGRWGVLLPLHISSFLGNSRKVDWKAGVPSRVCVDFVTKYERIGQIDVSGEMIVIEKTVVLSGPSVLRADMHPAYYVERVEDLPPELVRQLGALGALGEA